jgi:hypothetical protein
MAPRKTQKRKVAEKPDDTVNTINVPSPKSLFDLTPELRNRIYQFVVSVDDRISITKSEGFPEPPLLFTCKTVRWEAIGIHYLVNDLSLSIISFDPTILLLVAQKEKAMW